MVANQNYRRDLLVGRVAFAPDIEMELHHNVAALAKWSLELKLLKRKAGGYL